MEGSPARSQKLDGLTTLLIHLNGAATVAEFKTRLLEGIAGQIRYGQPVVILRSPESHDLDVENLKSSGDVSPVSPVWLRSHLERHPELLRKLNQGEMVGILVEGSTTPQPAGPQRVRRNLLLLPALLEGELLGVMGLALPVEAMQHSEDEVEFVRQLAHFVWPSIARLEELERLRRDHHDNDSLMAILEMQKHLQSNVAHELRTPLATVRGYTRMILDGRAGEIPQTQRDYLNTVTENTNRLIGLVNWMSHLLQYGAQHLTVVQTDLKELWNSCLKLQAPAISGKSIQLELKIPADSFVTTCDPDKIRSVFSSLLANAIQSSHDGGRISVEFSRGRQREITVKVVDSGENLPAEQLSRIFERQYSTPLSAARPADAGLAGVYDIIGLHGGRLFVKSDPGQGTTFLFSLPAVRQESMEKTG